MAMTNHERVGKALALCRDGLAPFVERELRAEHEAERTPQGLQAMLEDPTVAGKPILEWDVAALLKVMWDTWNGVFRKTLGRNERSLISELRDHRNRWAHQESFSSDDAYRALDSIARLLTAVSAPQSADVDKMKQELLRLRFDEQVRSERRKSTGTAVDSTVTGRLKPWREIIVPHPDVASGNYAQAEFAADLWQVYLGEGGPEYRTPSEFFRRTYITESLNRLLINAIHRLSGRGGDPVVQLQTNFGGGKTHSMLALYHLFSGTTPTDMPGIDQLMAEADEAELPKVHRVVLVGNKTSPGNPSRKPDGTVVHTLWGELAWQLGGKDAFERIRADDENATNPGDVLRELFIEHGPALILIDEWVAYARQLHDEDRLPGGTFETQFTFAQALTEAAKAAQNCLLVVSLPASDTGDSAHATADDVEVGGERGRAALDRLRNVVGRIQSTWRPATAEESFEIVRRRLFQPITDPNLYKARDVVAREFAELYRSQQQEFPPECHEADYEKRIKDAYPIHPEVFDRLYIDWSTQPKFQRTRGVLRLMATVIHALWQKGENNPLIMPGGIPIDDPRVQSELTRYLSDNWTPIIERDVDGDASLPVRIDADVPNLGWHLATRRVARAIYLGSAPVQEAATKGLEDRRIKLGTVMPGEAPAVFGDALRRLASSATYLYQDGNRYWYSTQPTVTKLAADRAEQLKRNPDAVNHELEERLRQDLRQHGEFSRVHPLPATSADVPDDTDARLVVLGADHPYSKEPDNAAEKAAKALLQQRGTTPRLYQNTLVFLAPDGTRLQDLGEALRNYLAWESILTDKIGLDLTPNQVRQAETQRNNANATVAGRLPETYQWLLVPAQPDPKRPMSWQAFRLTGQDPLAVRAAKKLRNDDLLVPKLGPNALRHEMDRIPLWRGNDVPIRQLTEDFARYLYLPRLTSSAVLTDAIGAGVGLITWESDGFAYAECFDEEAKRYRGLQVGRHVTITDSDPGVLVRPEAAIEQLDSEKKATPVVAQPPDATNPAGDTAAEPMGSDSGTAPPTGVPPVAPATRRYKRYHGTVALNPVRIGRDAGQIAEEIVAHLNGLVGAKVRVTLEIQAELEKGVPERVVRTVTENGNTLKFESQGFEED